MLSSMLSIIDLWKFFECATEDTYVEELISRVPDIQAILDEISKELKRVFDRELIIFNGKNKRELLRLPGKKAGNIRLKMEQEFFSVSQLKKLILGEFKVSEYLAHQSLFKLPIDSIVSFPGNATDSWLTLKQRVRYSTSEFKNPKELSTAKGMLEKEHVIWCYNNSCTGKTWMGINLLDKFRGVKYVYDFGSNQLLDLDTLKILLEWGTDSCILIDDMQLDIENSLEIIQYLHHHRDSIISRNLYIFLVSWTGMLENSSVKDYTKENGISCIKTDPDKFIKLLENQVRAIDSKLAGICGKNLFLLSKAVSLKSKRESLPYEEYLFRCFVDSEEEEQLHLIYICAVLGSYEFETPIAFLESYGQLNTEILKCGKIVNDSIYVGHREICVFVCEHLSRKYPELKRSEDIMMDYIRFLDGTLKWKALIHIVPESNKNKRSGVYSVGFIWNLLNNLIFSLRRAAETDSSFAGTPSSMCFALLIADYFREIDSFADVAESFASCFVIKDDHVVVDFGRVRTKEDFATIKARMCEEDVANPEFYKYYVPGKELDENLMHRIWLLSLIVQAGDVLHHFGYTKLVEFAEKDLLSLQENDGCWYPYRVPWITACVLRGLSKRGYSIRDGFIQKAVQYLTNTMNMDGYWEAHTGGWNRIYETSAMCLDALNKCGINCAENTNLLKALNFLREHSAEWMIEEYEIDGAAVACLLMDTLGVDEKLLEYIRELTQRNISSLFSIIPSERLTEESCKAALIAYYVTDLCWSILERDIDSLMLEFFEEASGKESRKNNTVVSQNHESITVFVQGGNNVIAGGCAKQIIMKDQE